MGNDSTVDADKIVRRVTLGGLFVNIGLSGFKFAAGIMGDSQALVADAIHSLSDGVTDVAVIAGSYFWSKPADECHPYGHKRIETFVTMTIGIVLLAAGIGIGWDAVHCIRNGMKSSPGLIALAAAFVSIVCKELVYQWTAARGRKVKSPALTANAWHHRLDAISSVPAVAAIAGAMAFPSMRYLDQVGAVVVSVFIMHASIKIILPGFREFFETGAPIEVNEKIRDIVYGNSAVRQVHKIRTRYVSSSLFVDLHIIVDGGMTVREGHNIAENVRRRLLNEGPDIVDAVIHVEPCEDAFSDQPFNEKRRKNENI